MIIGISKAISIIISSVKNWSQNNNQQEYVRAGSQLCVNNRSPRDPVVFPYPDHLPPTPPQYNQPIRTIKEKEIEKMRYQKKKKGRLPNLNFARHFIFSDPKTLCFCWTIGPFARKGEKCEGKKKVSFHSCS